MVSKKVSCYEKYKKFYDIIQESPLLAHDDANYIVGQAELDYKRMNELKVKLETINDISNKIWDWMCGLPTPLISLIPPIEKIRELSGR